MSETIQSPIYYDKEKHELVFALLYVTQNISLLSSNTDLLTASSKTESTEDLMLIAETEIPDQ